MDYHRTLRIADLVQVELERVRRVKEMLGQGDGLNYEQRIQSLERQHRRLISSIPTPVQREYLLER